jgi:hypothetical protein
MKRQNRLNYLYGILNRVGKTQYVGNALNIKDKFGQ